MVGGLAASFLPYNLLGSSRSKLEDLGELVGKKVMPVLSIHPWLELDIKFRYNNPPEGEICF